jgi:hypothetical protein
LSIMHHLLGPLPVIGSQPTTVSPSNEPQSRGNSETGVEVQPSIQTTICLVGTGVNKFCRHAI